MKFDCNSKLINENLNERELKILFLIANGASNAKVGMKLYLSPETIKFAVAAILKKLKVRNRAQAVFVVTENGIFKNNQSLFDSFKDEF